MKNKIAGKRDIESAFKLLCKSMPKDSYATLEMEMIRFGMSGNMEIIYAAYCDNLVPKLAYADTPLEAVNKLIERIKE
jgi:hypothetical protein